MDAEQIGPMPESYAIHCIHFKAAERSDKKSFDISGEAVHNMLRRALRCKPALRR